MYGEDIRMCGDVLGILARDPYDVDYHIGETQTEGG